MLKMLVGIADIGVLQICQEEWSIDGCFMLPVYVSKFLKLDQNSNVLLRLAGL